MHATELSVKDDEVVLYVPKLAYYFATHSKVCSFSSQKEYILLGPSTVMQPLLAFLSPEG